MRILAVVLLAVVGVTLWFRGTNERGPDRPTSSRGEKMSTDVSSDDLAAVARSRVFFGHQSVGMNLLDGISAVYASHGVAPPRIAKGRLPLGTSSAYIEHDYIGENEKPFLKLQDFDKVMRDGVAQQVDVAVMKFCYIDIRTDTDVEALFAKYRDTIAALERDFPKVTIVKMTVPVTTERHGLSMVKAWVTQSDRMGPAENAARERLNTLIRRQYAEDHLLDLAAVESTAPSGAVSTGNYQGQPYVSLYDGYASDSGHLNAEGSRLAAFAWIRAVAGAAR